MSSPVVAERGNHEYRVPPASRLIPGLPFPHAVASKKKPQSVTWDERYWVDEAEAVESARQALASEMCRAILPAPAAGSELWRVVTQASGDFALAALNLAALFSVFTFRAGLRVGPSIAQLGVVLVYSALLTLLAHSEGLYRGDVSDETEVVVLGKVVAWATVMVAGLLYASPVALSAVAINAPVSYFLLCTWRRWRRCHETSAHPVRRVLIVGAGRSGRDLAAQLGESHSRRVVCGFLDDENLEVTDVLGGLDDLAHVARAEFVDEVILTQDARREVARRVIREARKNRLDVKVVPDLYGMASPPVALERFGGTPVLTLHEEPIPVMGLLAKRALDFLLSSVAVVIASPLLAAIALLIKLDSAGPAIYRAVRVGKKGRHFYCYKFRTMRTDAEEMKEQLRARNERDGAFFKIADDPRITRVGQFLRRYSLDELPQFLNVWKGDMSMVGPRPHPVDDCERYRLQDLRRLDVMPGITGLWQVTARGDPSFERNMALDLEYIEHWSLWSDLKILVRTIAVVVQGSGA
jgi:exopolysaccharide biosynthesis polyprenyl glycosylphosphotransferase